MYPPDVELAYYGPVYPKPGYGWLKLYPLGKFEGPKLIYPIPNYGPLIIEPDYGPKVICPIPFCGELIILVPYGIPNIFIVFYLIRINFY